ncbi:unnamed protein product [Ectocarpus fasciculatus]
MHGDGGIQAVGLDTSWPCLVHIFAIFPTCRSRGKTLGGGWRVGELSAREEASMIDVFDDRCLPTANSSSFLCAKRIASHFAKYFATAVFAGHREYRGSSRPVEKFGLLDRVHLETRTSHGRENDIANLQQRCVSFRQ